MAVVKETGVEELRMLVQIADYTTESAFDSFNLLQTINILKACHKLDLETFADDLTHDERKFAAKHGRVSIKCLTRLYNDEGLEHTGPDWDKAQA